MSDALKYVPKPGVLLQVTPDIIQFLNGHHVWYGGDPDDKYYEVRQVYKQAGENILCPVADNPRDMLYDHDIVRVGWEYEAMIRNDEQRMWKHSILDYQMITDKRFKTMVIYDEGGNKMYDGRMPNGHEFEMLMNLLNISSNPQ